MWGRHNLALSESLVHGWSQSSAFRRLFCLGTEMQPCSWGGLVCRVSHSPDLSTCLTSGPVSLSPSQYGVQLYKNYQQAQSRHLRLSCVGSPPLVSVHRALAGGGYPGPIPGILGPHSDPSSPSHPVPFAEECLR